MLDVFLLFYYFFPLWPLIAALNDFRKIWRLGEAKTFKTLDMGFK